MPTLNRPSFDASISYSTLLAISSENGLDLLYMREISDWMHSYDARFHDREHLASNAVFAPGRTDQFRYSLFPIMLTRQFSSKANGVTLDGTGSQRHHSGTKCYHKDPFDLIL